jgi:hypothetical protein
MQVFLPTQNRCSLRFMQQVLREEKLMIQRQQVSTMFVPSWEECGVRTIWPQASRIREFHRYIPDEWSATEKTERKFFYGILTYLAPNFVQQVVNEAR